MEEVEVITSATGIPLAVIRGGREWKVAVDPVRWYERTDWWAEKNRMPKGMSYIDIEVWRVQVRLGRSAKSQLVTLDLVRDQEAGTWTVRSESTAE